MAKNSSSSRVPNTGAQHRDNLEEREKWPKRPKNGNLLKRHDELKLTKTLHRRHAQHCWKAVHPSLLHNKMSTDSGRGLNLRHLQLRDVPSLHNHRDVQLCQSTGTCGSHSFLHCLNHKPVICSATCMSTTIQNCTMESPVCATVCTVNPISTATEVTTSRR